MGEAKRRGTQQERQEAAVQRELQAAAERERKRQAAIERERELERRAERERVQTQGLTTRGRPLGKSRVMGALALGMLMASSPALAQPPAQHRAPAAPRGRK